MNIRGERVFKGGCLAKELFSLCLVLMALE